MNLNPYESIQKKTAILCIFPLILLIHSFSSHLYTQIEFINKPLDVIYSFQNLFLNLAVLSNINIVLKRYSVNFAEKNNFL